MATTDAAFLKVYETLSSAGQGTAFNSTNSPSQAAVNGLEDNKRVQHESSASPAASDQPQETRSGERLDGPVDWRSRPFKPAYRVDQVRWPNQLDQIAVLSPGEVENLGNRLASLISDGRSLFLFTACRPQSGSTTCTLLAARWLIQHGQRVAVVDASCSTRSLAAQLGIVAPADWLELLQRGYSFEEASLDCLSGKLCIVSRATMAGNEATGTRDPARMAQATYTAANRLRRHYDAVLVDCGQWLKQVDHAGQELLLKAVDCLICVHRASDTTDILHRGSSCKCLAKCWHGRGGVVTAVVENFGVR